MHVDSSRRVHKGKVYETHLLRRTFREDGKVKHETLGNLSHLPKHVIESIKLMLKGHQLVAPESLFVATQSVLHGHVQAVLTAMRKLELAGLVSSTPCRERDLVLAMIASRVLAPSSKLASTRWWHTTTLPEELSIADADEDELYAALDWLGERQGRIEKKLAKRHLRDGGFALYDLSSSYFEGEHCTLARRGYSRDGKRGTLQVNYGLLTDADGRPVAIEAYEGNRIDSTTVLDQFRKLREQFKLERVCVVGDRGIFAETHLEEMKAGGADWITALKSGTLRRLVKDGTIQLGLFDERNLFSFTHKDFPGERLVACRNPVLGRKRAAKRQSMLEATCAKLGEIQTLVATGHVTGRAEIGVRIGREIDRYKMRKHIRLEIRDDGFDYAVDEVGVADEAQMDGIYVVRTSLDGEVLDDAGAVRTYKQLAHVERAFRTFKGVDLLVRPIYHRLETRVRAHLFLCMLAYYVTWHLKRAWAPLLFADENPPDKTTRDPVAPAERSESATAKARANTLTDGTRPHGYQTLLADLSTIVRLTMARQGDETGTVAYKTHTIASDKQRRALELVEAIAV